VIITFAWWIKPRDGSNHYSVLLEDGIEMLTFAFELKGSKIIPCSENNCG
jgi:hypothetical protein